MAKYDPKMQLFRLAIGMLIMTAAVGGLLVYSCT